MDQLHSIVPPPELVQQWSYDWHRAKVKHVGCAEYIAIQAARWGADQELQACLQLLDINGCHSKWIDMLRAARRRPKPPSLVEQALEACERSAFGIPGDRDIIRRALERLQELESNG